MSFLSAACEQKFVMLLLHLSTGGQCAAMSQFTEDMQVQKLFFWWPSEVCTNVFIFIPLAFYLLLLPLSSSSAVQLV